jgi:hypothetical protein
MVSETPELDGPAELAGAEVSTATAWHKERSFPLRVGEIQIDEQGRIQPRDSAVPVTFGFAYRGIQYQAKVEATSEPRVRIIAELGKLPYSMEIGTGRQLIRQILNVSARANYGRIGLSKDHDIRLEATSTPPEPFTPASLMATLTVMLLAFQPYLDFLAQVLEDAQRPKPVEALEPTG